MAKVAQSFSALAMIVAFTAPASAEPIFVSPTFQQNNGTCCVPFTPTASIFLGIYDGSFGGIFRIFDSYTFTSADVGRTFSVTPESDPDFPLFVSTVTNGVNDFFSVAVLNAQGLGGADIGQELFLFEGLLPVRLGPDLLGYEITQINLNIARLMFTPFPGPLGGVTVDAAFNFTFEGSAPPIPEPGTLGLVLGGVATLVARARYRRGRSL